MGKNDKISISEFVNTQLNQTIQYKKAIDNDGLKINIKNDICFVYSYGLATIFTLKEIPAINIRTDEHFQLDGCIYIDSFYKGFLKGKRYFIDEFKRNPFQSKETIADTVNTFYNDKWSDYVEGNICAVMSHKIIEEWGYYSGTIFELKKFKELNKNLFKESKAINFYLVDMFKDQNQYNKIVNLLVENKVVTQNGVLLQIKYSQKNIVPLRLISCIGYLLINKNYLEKKAKIKLNQKKLVHALSNTFTVNLTEATYSASKKQFIEATNSYNLPGEIYLKALKFLE